MEIIFKYGVFQNHWKIDGMVKNRVYVSSLLTDLCYFQHVSTAVINSMDRDIMIRVWWELPDSMDVARAAGGDQILKDQMWRSREEDLGAVLYYFLFTPCDVMKSVHSFFE